MKYIHVIFKSLLILLLIMIVSNPASAEVQEIDIVTTPEKVLFDVANMKPGDWAERELTIKNSGTQDFDYLFSSNLKSGSRQLYNELVLTVSKGETELYKGKLGGFSKLDPRSIPSGSEEILTLRVDFPAELGNEYQGLTCEVEFKFYVEGTLGGVLPVDGPKLPETATNMFNYLVAGIGLLTIGLFLQFRRIRIANRLRRS